MQNASEILDGLIRQTAAGQKSAFAELYEYAKGPVYAFALSVLKSPEDAEDVMQDVFMDVWRSAGHYKSVGKPMGWIIAIAKNSCFMKLRSRKNHPEQPLDHDFDFNLNSGLLSPEEAAVIRCTLTELSDSEMQILVLHAVAGLKHREISQMLGLSLPAVLSRYNRTVKKLKSKLLE